MRATKSKLDSVSLRGLIALCAGMPILLGGVPDWTVWFAAVSLSSLILWGSTRTTVKVSPRTAVPILATLYFLAQLIPLPNKLLNLVSPNAAIWINELNVAWAPLSLNAYETLLSTMVQYCFVTALVLGSMVSTRQVRQLTGSIACSAAMVSLIGWLHIIMDWQLVFGFYQAQDINNPEGFVTSFINSNTCAGFLCLGVAASFGLTFEQGNPRLLRLGLIGAYLNTAGVIMTESKSGLIALTVMCFCWFYALYLNPKFYRIRAYKPYRRTLLWFICPALIMAILILLLLPAPEKFDGWFAAFERKLDILQATDYIRDFWAFGSGRGSFETVFPIYQVNQVRGTFSHAENIIFQLLVECGVFISVLIIGWAIYLIIQLSSKLEFGAHPLHWSLGIALLMITLQQLTDFGLESLGLILPFAVLLGRLMRSEGPPTIRISPWFTRAWAFFPLIVVAIHAGMPRNPVSDQNLSVFQQCTSIEETLTQVTQMATAAPSDYLIYENGLHNLIRCHPKEWRQSLQLAKKAQHRAPNRGETRLLTAQLLAQHNYLSQAAVEFKAAIELSPWLWNEARVPIHSYLGKIPALLFAAVGERPQHRNAMLGYLIGNQEYQAALSFLNQWLLNGIEPNEYNTRKALICVRTRNVECLKILSAASTITHPGRSMILNSWLAFLRNDGAKARLFLTKASQKDLSIRLSSSDAIVARELAIELKELQLARAFVSIQWAQSDSVAKRTQALYASGMLEQQFGNLREAVIALEKVYQLTPNHRYLVQALKLEIKRKNALGARLKLTKLKGEMPNHPELNRLEQLVEELD